MTDPKQVQGSNGAVAEGGLNAEAAFTDLGGAARRMALEAQGEEADGESLTDAVRAQMRQAPGGLGTVPGRDENEER